MIRLNQDSLSQIYEFHFSSVDFQTAFAPCDVLVHTQHYDHSSMPHVPSTIDL